MNAKALIFIAVSLLWSCKENKAAGQEKKMETPVVLEHSDLDTESQPKKLRFKSIIDSTATTFIDKDILFMAYNDGKLKYVEFDKINVMDFAFDTSNSLKKAIKKKIKFSQYLVKDSNPSIFFTDESTKLDMIENIDNLRFKNKNAYNISVHFKRSKEKNGINEIIIATIKPISSEQYDTTIDGIIQDYK